MHFSKENKKEENIDKKKDENVIIEFSNISKSFGKKKIIDNFNLKIYKGDVLGIIGKSGSGKSTLLNILMGIYKPDDGKILYKGKEINYNKLKKIIGLTTQENSFYYKLSVYENMVYYANLYDVKKEYLKDYILDILKSVELDNSLNTIAEKLSGGMKRRLDFAISLLHEPEILILDEPTTGLDPLLVKQFWKIVNNYNKKGKTIILVSHIFPEILENCNKVCLLSKGRYKIMDINKNMDLLKEFEEFTN
ncbi:MAG: ABC transporter ATP-binding protein [Candidatus Woesearchaeota archaeon]